MVKKKKGGEKKAKPKTKEEAKEEGAAEEILENIPFIGGIFKAVKKSPVFQERLKEVNEEIKEKLKKGGKKEPVVEFGYRVGSIKGGTIRGRFEGTGIRVKPKPEEKAEVKKVEPGEARKEHLVDIFKEKKGLKIITELPNVKEKEIKVKVDEKKLIIAAGEIKREVALPYLVKGKVKKSYKNNILEIKLEKK